MPVLRALWVDSIEDELTIESALAADSDSEEGELAEDSGTRIRKGSKPMVAPAMGTCVRMRWRQSFVSVQSLNFPVRSRSDEWRRVSLSDVFC
jgi:hypothetical protein